MNKKFFKPAASKLFAILTVVLAMGVFAVFSVYADCPEHADFDSTTGILTVPYLDVPLIDPISQQEIPDQDAVFSCTMKYANHSGGSFSIKDITYLPGGMPDDCHAKYDYDGTIYIPDVDVTTVIVLPWNNIIEGPVETYAVTLKQLMLSSKYFHFESAVITSQPAATAQPVLSGPSSGLQEADITITIDNYSDTAQYDIAIDDGTFTRTGDTITWTLPSVSADTDMSLEITATESGQSVSEVLTLTVTVTSATTEDTLLLISSDNSDGDTTFIDSAQGRVVTAYDATHSTEQSVIGSSSIKFNSSINSYINVADSDDWDLTGTNSLTIEAYVWFNKIAATWTPIISHYSSPYSKNTWFFAVHNSGGLTFRCWNSDGTNYTMQQGDLKGWKANTWYKIKLEISSSTVNIYRDGTLLLSDTLQGSFLPSNDLWIGRMFAYGLNGYMDEIKISN